MCDRRKGVGSRLKLLHYNMFCVSLCVVIRFIINIIRCKFFIHRYILFLKHIFPHRDRFCFVGESVIAEHILFDFGCVYASELWLYLYMLPCIIVRWYNNVPVPTHFTDINKYTSVEMCQMLCTYIIYIIWRSYLLCSSSGGWQTLHNYEDSIYILYHL